MCSRYESSTEAELARVLKANVRFPKGTKFKPLIYPGYQAPIVREREGERAAEDRFWGFVARFPGKREPGKMIEKIMQNAVSETIDEKRTFKSAWEKSQRCLIPARRFFEPKDGEFRAIVEVDQPLVVMAGLWGETTFKGEKREAFTMLTCEPNKFMEPFHDRMPVILDPKDWDEWISVDTTPDQAQALCRPYKKKLAFED